MAAPYGTSVQNGYFQTDGILNSAGTLLCTNYTMINLLASGASTVSGGNINKLAYNASSLLKIEMGSGRVSDLDSAAHGLGAGVAKYCFVSYVSSTSSGFASGVVVQAGIASTHLVFRVLSGVGAYTTGVWVNWMVIG